MALTIASPTAYKPDTVFGDRRVAVRNLTWDASYPTGGLAFTPAQAGMSRIDWIDSIVTTPAGSATALVWDNTNSKIKVNTAAGEMANATNLSTLVTQATIYGV